MRAEPNTRPNSLSDRYIRPREDDFRRLGLGTSEARVSIIREAAQRATESANARQGPKSSGPAIGESEIAQVVASVYRLLDPRRRDAVLERIQLVRTEPTPVRTWLWGDPETVTEGTSEGLESESSSHDDDWMLEMLADLRTDSPFERDGISAPPVSSLPRLRTGTAGRRRRSLPSSMQQLAANRWFRMGLIGSVVLVGLMSLAYLFSLAGTQGSGSSPNNTANAGDVQGEGIGIASDLAGTLGNDATPGNDAQATAGSGNRIDPSGSNPLSGSTSGDRIPPAAIPTNDTGNETSPSVLPHLDVNPGSASPSLADVLNSENSTELGTDSNVSMDRSGSGSANNVVSPNSDAWLSGIVPEPLQAPPSSDENPQPPTPPAEDIAETTGNAEEEPSFDPAALPDSVELDAAKENVEQRLATSGPSVALGVALAEELWKQGIEQPRGSAQRLAFAWATARQLVLNGRLAEAMAVIEQTTREYKIAPGESAFEVLQNSSEAAVTSSEHEQLCEWGIRCSELALLQENFELASEAARLATVAAVATQEETLRDRCRTQRDAIATAERMSDTVQERLRGTSVETASVRDSALIGRHLCLNLRRWNEGLPWLAKAEIARLSRCAQDELMVGESPGPKDLAELGRQWITAAEAQRAGRIADSMLARGRDLLQQAADATQGVQQLELQKELRELDEDLPADLLPLNLVEGQRWVIAASGGPVMASNGGPAAPSNAGTSSSDDDQDNASMDTLPPTRGMLARLTVGNHPATIGIRFSPRVPLAEVVFRNLLRLENMPMERFRMEAHGTFQVESQSRVRILARGPVGLQPTTDGTFDDYETDGMRVLLNDRQVPLKLVSDAGPGARALDFELAPGLYRIAWQFQGLRMPPAELRVLNVDTGEDLTIRNDLITRSAIRSTPITRWVVLRPSAAVQ